MTEPKDRQGEVICSVCKAPYSSQIVAFEFDFHTRNHIHHCDESQETVKEMLERTEPVYRDTRREIEEAEWKRLGQKLGYTTET